VTGVRDTKDVELVRSLGAANVIDRLAEDRRRKRRASRPRGRRRPRDRHLVHPHRVMALGKALL
jgi:hypothetical protein